jgi:two-component system phosphate regulon sensor histidine kinase PhoR
MNWILPRMLRALVLLALGALLGGWAGMRAAMPATGVAGGAALALLLFVLWDAVPALRFMRWLRGPMEGAAPRDPRFWGELAYRVERALRLRDKQVAAERQRLAQFLSAIEASPNGVVLLDARDQIEWLNSVAADHLGIDPQRDIAQRITNLVRAPAFVDHMQAGQFADAVVFPAPGGGTLSVLVREYGDGARLLLTQDITERLRNDAMRRDFVANVSHEIRTPLTVLAGFVDTLAALPLTEVERQRVLVLMRQQTDRMQTLVGDLLTLAQLEGSPRPPADRWLPVAELMQRVESDALGLSKGRHRLRVSGEPGDTQVAGVEAELLSAVGNLMTNAVRYTPDGGEIELAWHPRPDGGGEFEVRDTGIGIAREHLPRLTERFYRVDGSRSRETGGTGLGLSIVKHVAQRHGGELHVNSELGKGSSFRLQLPASRVRLQPGVVVAAEG